MVEHALGRPCRRLRRRDPQDVPYLLLGVVALDLPRSTNGHETQESCRFRLAWRADSGRFRVQAGGSAQAMVAVRASERITSAHPPPEGSPA